MTSKVTINRLSTGVAGLDDVLGGGLPEFSFNLIAGAPGCGKTTLAHQMMFALATPERPGLYFTVLGEPPLKMLRYQQQFGFFDNDAINRSVYFVNLSDEALSGDFDRVLQAIVASVEAHKPAVVFVDSFRSMSHAGSAERAHNELQQFVQQLGMLMTSWQATTFLIGEYGAADEANPVFTVADGMLCLTQSVERNSMVRKLQVTKMRGQATLPGSHTFRITHDGIRVFAPAPVAAATSSGAGPLPERAMTGVAALDAMLGGGLPRGYSLLVAGPSGSGKSILASSFLVEGDRCGETGVIAAFDQNPFRSRDRRIADLIDRGRVGLVHNLSPDLSIDETVQHVLQEIRRLGATRVVIDSLSGFELSIAPAFREDFRENMLRMVTAFAAEGVTVLMTSELEDRYTDLRFSPYGTAFLTDAIVVQRYMEVDSRLLRMMAVVKVRASEHSNELREYTIDDAGIQVGGRLVDLEGLLGGRPRRKGQRGPGDDAEFADSGQG
jgi:circadian clock protein KaiC